jgi:hypothetical protein
MTVASDSCFFLSTWYVQAVPFRHKVAVRMTKPEGRNNWRSAHIA